MELWNIDSDASRLSDSEALKYVDRPLPVQSPPTIQTSELRECIWLSHIEMFDSKRNNDMCCSHGLHLPKYEYNMPDGRKIQSMQRFLTLPHKLPPTECRHIAHEQKCLASISALREIQF